MNILYVATDVELPSNKGSSTHTLEVASGLKSLGNEVQILCRRSSGDQAGEGSINGMTVHRVFRGIIAPVGGDRSSPPGRGIKRNLLVGLVYDAFLHTFHSFFCAYKAVKITRKARIDALLERGSSLGAGAIASLLTGLPLVTEVIDYRHVKYSLIQAGRVIAYRRDVLKSDLPPDRLRIVPAGANTDLFSVSRERDIGLVGYAGSFRAWHGVETLLQAARILKDKGQPARFVMIGPGNEDCCRLADELGVLNYINFTGALKYENLPRILGRCSILVAPFNPSVDPYMKEHGFIFSPLKIFEYMSLSRAIISSNLEKIREVISHQNTGILVSPGSSEEIALAIGQLISRPVLAERLGKRARRTVLRLYSWERLSKIINTALLDSIPGRSE